MTDTTEGELAADAPAFQLVSEAERHISDFVRPPPNVRAF